MTRYLLCGRLCGRERGRRRIGTGRQWRRRSHGRGVERTRAVILERPALARRRSGAHHRRGGRRTLTGGTESLLFFVVCEELLVQVSSFDARHSLCGLSAKVALLQDQTRIHAHAHTKHTTHMTHARRQCAHNDTAQTHKKERTGSRNRRVRWICEGGACTLLAALPRRDPAPLE
jgi:hypothetical protein